MCFEFLVNMVFFLFVSFSCRMLLIYLCFCRVPSRCYIDDLYNVCLYRKPLYQYMYINIYHHALIEGPFMLTFHLTYHTLTYVELKIVKPIALNTYQLSVIFGTVTFLLTHACSIIFACFINVCRFHSKLNF